MPDVVKLEPIERAHAEGLSLIEEAGLVEVTDADSSDSAGRLLVSVKRQITQIEDARKEITRPLDLAKSRAMEQEKAAKKPYEEAKQHLEGEILGWTLKERQRIAAEAAAAEAERIALEAAAMRAADEGRFEEAEEIQVERDSLGTVERVHRAAGTQARFTWVGTVTKVEDLILAVASGEAPVGLLNVNQSALNDFARATKGKQHIPGVRFSEKPVLAATDR